MTFTQLQRRLLVGAGCAAALAAGCGEEDEGDPIPRATAQALERQLTAVENRLANGSRGACDDIQNIGVRETGQILGGIPEGVDVDVRNALTESFDRLFELADEECQTVEEPETTETEPPPPPETTTTETETETTAPETTEQTETETQPQDGDNNEGGGGNDGGGGGLIVPEGE